MKVLVYIIRVVRKVILSDLKQQIIFYFITKHLNCHERQFWSCVWTWHSIDGESHYFYQTHFDYFLNEYGGGGVLPLLFKRNTVFHIIFCFILLCFLCDLFRAGIKSSEFINSLYPWDLLDDTLTFYNIPKLIPVCLTLAVFKEKI